MSGIIRLQPSSAETWLSCTAMPVFVADHEHELPDDSSSYANEGNVAHEFAAKMLTGEEPEVPDVEMLRHLKKYVQFVKDKVKPGDRLMVEQKLPLWYLPSRNGISDVVIVDSKPQAEKLYVIDLKYGEGKAVYARNNPQLAIYGRNAVESLKKAGRKFTANTLITLCIFQPRCSHGEPVTLWALRLSELEEFTRRIEDRAKLTLKRKDLEFVPSPSNCQFCKASALCGERARSVAGELGFDILPTTSPAPRIAAPRQALALPEPSLLSREDIGRILAREDDIKSWLTSLRKFAHGELERGKPIPGWAMVDTERLGDRQWVDEEDAAMALELFVDADKLWSRKLVSPAQAEKLIGKNELKEIEWETLFHRPKSTTKLMVTSDDPRAAALTVTAESEFEPIDDGADLL